VRPRSCIISSWFREIGILEENKIGRGYWKKLIREQQRGGGERSSKEDDDARTATAQLDENGISTNKDIVLIR
jgi:hypothetical protein